MISDEERRAIARELRATDMADIEENGYILDSPKYVGLLFMRMLDKACDYRPGLHYFPDHFSAQAACDLFADLIDRPTCKMEEITDQGVLDECPAYFRPYGCSRCGEYYVMSKYDAIRYCPSCGAEVVK